VYGPDRSSCWSGDQSVSSRSCAPSQPITYDDDLMATFCDFSRTSQQKLEKVVALFGSDGLPGVAR